MKRALILLAAIVVLLTWLQPFTFGTRTVVIPKGASGREVARILGSARVVRHQGEFLLWLRLLRREHSIKYGTYELPTYQSPLLLIPRLTTGGRSDFCVTIPEGLTINETALVLEQHGVTRAVDFVTACRDPNLARELGVPGVTLEGYLFPDTYYMYHGQDALQVARQLVRTFFVRTAGLGPMPPDSLHRVVILASLVEKEAKHDDERPLIARVFLNRIGRHRPLESCATVFYVLRHDPAATLPLGNDPDKKTLTERDLKIASPYNTYLHPGLPPGPICSPGLSSISAAAVPAESDYLYFVAKGDGHHQFSRTYAEHRAAQRRYHAPN